MCNFAKDMNKAINIYEIFYNLRYHHENEVVESFAKQSGKAERKKAVNSFDFDDIGCSFLTD